MVWLLKSLLFSWQKINPKVDVAFRLSKQYYSIATQTEVGP
jgi:hypothetical protein